MANIAPVYSCIDKGFKENAEEIPFQSKLPDIKHFSAQGRLNVDNYVVLYIVDETNERVEIVRIPYGAMDLD